MHFKESSSSALVNALDFFQGPILTIISYQSHKAYMEFSTKQGHNALNILFSDVKNVRKLRWWKAQNIDLHNPYSNIYGANIQMHTTITMYSFTYEVCEKYILPLSQNIYPDCSHLRNKKILKSLLLYFLKISLLSYSL